MKGAQPLFYANREIAKYLNEKYISTKEYFFNKNRIRKTNIGLNNKLIWFASQVRTIIKQKFYGNLNFKLIKIYIRFILDILF